MTPAIALPLPIGQLVPAPDLFRHPSRIHGQKHVARVLVHALRLVEATGYHGDCARLWCAVFLHDLERTHDGHCVVHGAEAWRRFEATPALQDFVARAGVSASDHAAIGHAVRHHCVPSEVSRAHPHWRLTALLKDADALDRVRIDDLDPSYLRFEASHSMIAFAERLFRETDPVDNEGPGYFDWLWAEASRLDGA